MKMLSLDSSGKTAAAAVTEDGALLGQSFANGGLTHSQTLMPMVDDLLKQCSVSIDEIDEFAFTVGPGSFTGVRIGAALMMGLAGDRPCRPVSTLDALARRLSDKVGAVVPVIDAGNDRVYMKAYLNDGSGMRLAVEEVDERVIEVTVRCGHYPNQLWFIGDGAYKFRYLDSREHFHYVEGDEAYLRGIDVARAAELVTPVSASEVKLNYIKLPQAEIERRKRDENKHGV